MKGLVFRDLRADEIDCRVATINEKGLSLLLYKDARCDMNILDETVGSFNWQRIHSRDNANCTVLIWDSEKSQWISKEDTGTESNTEAAKGLASDSFKRACFNWGIGRELYTAPFIWIKAENYNVSTKNGKPTTYDKFSVKSIEITEKKITGLTIQNDTKRQIVYTFGKNQQNIAPFTPEPAAQPAAQPTAPVATPAPAQPQPAPELPHRIELRNYIKENNLTKEEQTLITQACGLGPKSTDQDYELALIFAKTLLIRGGQG